MQQTKQEKRVCPDWRILIRDETQYWTDELVKRCGGKIKGAYFFDANRHVHCCEFTPSFELERLKSIPEQQYPDDEQIMESLESELSEEDIKSDSGSCTYIHVSDIDLESDSIIPVWKMTELEWQTLLEDADGDSEKAHDVAMDVCLEYINANGFC